MIPFSWEPNCGYSRRLAKNKRRLSSFHDPLDYFARLHHTSADTFDHLRPDDLRQASVVMAGMLLAAASDKDTIVPLPLPQQPRDTEPFEYDYPED